MPGFVRRFTTFPSLETLTEIESIDIIDLVPASPTTGVGSGTLLCLGEFEDGPFAVGGDAAEFLNPPLPGGRALQVTEVFGSEDLRNRYGGFGYSYAGVPHNNPSARRHLFEFWNGNGFLKLKFLRPRRLVVGRVDTSVGEVAMSPIASIEGGVGPFALSVADVITATTDIGGPASSVALTAVVATVVGGVFPGVTSLFVGGEQISITVDGGPAVIVTFSAADQTPAQVAARINLALGYTAATVAADIDLTGIQAGLGGSMVLADVTAGALVAIGHAAGTTAGTGSVQNINAATAAEIAAIVTASAPMIAIDCEGRIGPGGELRIVSTTPGVGTINITSTAMAIACGLAPIATTVTAGEHGGGTIPAGTRVRNVGLDEWVTMQTLTVAAGTAAAPNVGPHVVKVRPALDDGTAATALVGTVTTLVDAADFADLTVSNAVALTAARTEPQMDVAYEAAFDATLDLRTAAREANHSLSARRSDAIRVKGRQNSIDASANGMFGRKFHYGAAVGFTQAQATAEVALTRLDRTFFCWPGWQVRIPEIAVRGTAGGLGFTEDGWITVRSDGPLASINARLNPEENPGQQTGLIEEFARVEEVAAGSMTIDNYIALRAAGICAPRRDRVGGSIYQSGVTSSLTSGEETQARRKMADFVQDTLAERSIIYSKRLTRQSRRDALVAMADSFLSGLLSEQNPELQRIDGYSIDERSANTPELLAAGVFIIITKVRTLPSLDTIAWQTEIGPNAIVVTEL
jgi:hypothetical protein